MKLFLTLTFIFCLSFFTIAQIRIGYPLYLNKTTGIGELGYSKCIHNTNPSKCLIGDLALRGISYNNKLFYNLNAKIGVSKLYRLNPSMSIIIDFLSGYSLLTHDKNIENGMILSTSIKVKNTNISKTSLTIGYSYQTNSALTERLNNSIFIGLTIPI
jgi:hypothetical protein